MVSKSPDFGGRFHKSTLVIFMTILIIGFSRHLPLSYPELLNFSPVLAIFMISGTYLRGNLSWIAPMIGVVASDLLLNPNYGANFFESFMLITLFSYSLIFIIGKKLGENPEIKTLAQGGLGAAIMFHLITCGFAWWVNAAYTKDLAGFIQAIIFGQPEFAPAYLFLKNTIISTVFFSVLLGWAFSLQIKFVSAKTPKPVHSNVKA